MIPINRNLQTFPGENKSPKWGFYFVTVARMKLIALILLVGVCFNSQSQNLIRNPSFEEDSATYKYWNPMMGSTVDFYSEKNPEKLSMGFQKAKSGSKFVGLSILKIDKARG